MSDRGATSGSGPRIPETDNASGAYVLHALSDEEREAFEGRLDESEELRTEVAELNDTALLLGHAARPVTPSPALRASILDLIESTPQLPKLETEDPRGVHADEAESQPARLAPQPEAQGDAEILAPTPLAHQRWFMRPAVLLAGAVAAVGLIFGGSALVNGIQGPGSSQTPPGTSTAMSQILSSSDVQHTVADVATGGKATLYWSASLQRSAVILNGVSVLPKGKTYQLWYINGSSVTSAGTLTAKSDVVSKVLQGDLKSGDTIGMTVEPAGGSKQPTTKPIVAIQSA
jgi:anti-sigma-K factor RskA